MKSNKFQAALFFLVILATAAPAYANSFNVSASVTTYWDSLRITADPVVSITWLGTSNQTEAIHFFNNATIANFSTPNLDSLSYANQLGGVATSGDATASSLTTNILWSDYPPSGTDWMNIQREKNFLVTGSGNVTFAIDYNFASSRLIDSSALSYPYIQTSEVLEADLMLYIPYVQSFAYDQHWVSIPSAIGSVSDSLSQAGTATVSYQVSDGETYWIRGESHSIVTVAAPELSSTALLGFGLVGIALGWYHQRKNPQK